jgi:hypothetical protein
MKATQEQLTSWRGSGRQYQVIAAAIAEWAASQERGTVLPDNQLFGRRLALEPSDATFHRAKRFLATQGVLEANDGPYYVA